MSAFDPGERYAALRDDGRIEVTEGGRAFWEQPHERIDRDFGADWLVSEFVSEADWTSWERHPDADELVYLLDGEAEMHFEREGGIEIVALSKRAAAVIPKGVWHTAKVRSPSRLLFVTMGRGTDHRPVGTA